MVTSHPPSKFDRLYDIRKAKRWRDGSAIGLGLSLLILAVLVLDPLFSHRSPEAGMLLLAGGLCTVFLVVTLSFHLRYRSRE